MPRNEFYYCRHVEIEGTKAKFIYGIYKKAVRLRQCNFMISILYLLDNNVNMSDSRNKMKKKLQKCKSALERNKMKLNHIKTQ